MSSGRKRILVTGPDGFVGFALCSELLRQGYDVTGAQWQAAPLPDGCRSVVVGDIGADTEWSPALAGVDTVVHLAARVHIMDDTAPDPLAEFRRINVCGTRRLASDAVRAGVRRFVLMSTIKVNGERTDNLRLRSEEGERGGAFAEIDPAAPEDAYGLSKWEAECSLHDAARGSAMETVVLRAPLLYGAGVKGNLHSLLKLAATGIPLPLGSVRNRRSLLYRGNLVDVIVRCVEHPAAANELFVLSDGQDLSTADLLRELRRAMGMPPRLVRFPPRLLRLLARLSGKAQVMDRLLGSLAVDSTKVRTLLSWRPRYSVQEGLREMVGGAR